MASSNLNIWKNRRSSKAIRQITTSRQEGSMRDEIYDLIYGSSREIAKGSRGVYRKIRTTGSGNTLAKVPCDCVKQGEADKTPPCPICNGEKFLWDEIWFDYYKTEVGIDAHLALKEDFETPGVIAVPRVVFYTLYNLDPIIINGMIDDKIVEVKRDLEGKIVQPYERIRTYRIGSAIDFRSDHGRLEYWKIVSVSDDIPGLGLASRV